MHHLISRPTLVMGASGAVGRHVLSGLLDAGVPVRVSTRRPQQGQFQAGLDVRAADLTDASSLRAAFAGVGSVFLYANLEGARGIVDAAQTCGVQRIVLMSSGSVVHPTSAGNAITEEHREVEHVFAAATDLRMIPVRPLVLATNALRWSYPISAGAPLALYQPDARTAPIHERDVAAVAVAALTGDFEEDLSEMLTGPDLLTQREQVTAIGGAIGREIVVHELSRDAAAQQFARFMAPSEAEAVVQFLDDAAAGNSPTTTSVQTILGRSALGFAVWAREHADDFR